MSPGCSCIVKGKEHKKYGVDNKVPVIRSATGIILGVMSFRNEYDGHTIEPSPVRVERLVQRLKKHKLFRKRAGIEPTIGHLKSDFRSGRNFYKGVVGDAMNELLAATAYNFKRAMKALLNLIRKIFERLCIYNISMKAAF